MESVIMLLSINRWLWYYLLLSIVVVHATSSFVCLSNPCVHGVCVDQNNSQYSCYCIDGYTGVQCQTNWDECWSNPCQNGGICIDGIASFNCTCPPGFVGDLCEENFDECESNPCQNNGTCIDAMNGYICSCQPGYLGVHCEIDVAVCNTTAETRCANGGECVEGPGMTFTCKCSKGWGGFLCDVELNECMSDPCQNGALCIDLHADYLCACRFGFTGKNCEEKVIFCEHNPCKNRALCLMEENHPVCYCVPDYHGEKCELQYDECQLGPRCMNGGTCIDGVDSFSCSCPPKLTGLFCECLIVSGDAELDCSYVSTITTSTFTNVTSTTPFISTTTEVPQTQETITMSTMSSTHVPNATFSSFETSSSTKSTTSLETDVTSTALSTLTSSGETWTSSPESTTSEIITTKSTTNYFNESFTESTTEMFTTDTTFEETVTTSTKVTPFTDTTFEETVTTSFTIPPSTTREKELPTSHQIPTFSVEVPATEIFSTVHTSSWNPTTMITEYYSEIPSSTTLIPFTTLTTATTTSSGVQTIPTWPNRTLTITSEFATSPLITELTVTMVPVTRPSTRPETTLFFTESPTIKTETPTTTASSTTETTSMVPENFTVSTIYPDCSREENRCQNGGTCIFGAQGHKCICPFNTEGPVCEFRKGISNAAFGGNSYLVHRLTNISGVEVQFKAKTVSENGLLLYSTIDGTYMCLYIEKGFLKFKFSCGYQTMLLSELKNPINNGFDTIIYAKLEFDKDFKRCFSVVKVNNTLSMSGDQIAMVAKLYKPSAWLYLGGAPEEHSLVLPSPGFVGCMGSLRISGQKMRIYGDAEEGKQITECSSLACLSNPCKNGGTCTSNRKGWNCLCKNGFLGSTCEKSICDNNPCLFGATCLAFTGSGYICLCPFGKHGHFCENDIQISEPYFSPTIDGYSSYSAYPIPPGAILDNMELKFKFSPTTMDQISILMFIGQAGMHDVTSDHMAVSFVKGYIMLTWNLGAGPRRIFTSRPIEKDKEEYLVKLGRNERRAWLAVEGLGNVTGRSKGKFVQLDVVSMLYLGGYDSLYFSTLPHDLPLHTGFEGCIFDVELKAGSVIIPLQSSRHALGRAIGQCGISECHENSCQNGGICLHHASTFSCLCQDGWFGPLCSLQYNPCDEARHNCSSGSVCVPFENRYECDCPFGKTGKFCENNNELTDITFSGKRSFLSLITFDLIPAKFDIQFELRPLSEMGLIVYIGSNGKSFFSLSVQSGFLELRALPANRVQATNEVLILRSRKLLARGNWYNVRVGQFGRKLYVAVENITNTILLERNDHLKISGDLIFLGGLADMSELPVMAVATLPIPYTGCLRHLKIDTKPIEFNSSSVKTSQNVDDCDGTPCGGDYCKNNGICWLDSQLKPHCSCTKFYGGPRCENPPSCQEKGCKNGGKCVNYNCHCVMGFTGAFCETAIKVMTPEFMGNSYIILKKIDKKRDLGKVGVKNLYINFTTADKNGLIFWGSKHENFIGIGIEGGHLKLAYTVKNGNRTIIEIPETDSLADGIWHTLEISFGKANLRVKIDGKTVLSQNRSNFVADLFDLSDGVFYLGGLPTERNETIWQKTHNMFHAYFKGCIKAFGINNILAVTDFSHYDGTNIGICDVI